MFPGVPFGQSGSEQFPGKTREECHRGSNAVSDRRVSVKAVKQVCQDLPSC